MIENSTTPQNNVVTTNFVKDLAADATKYEKNTSHCQLSWSLDHRAVLPWKQRWSSGLSHYVNATTSSTALASSYHYLKQVPCTTTFP
jgi:hypothetical protein